MPRKFFTHKNILELAILFLLLIIWLFALRVSSQRVQLTSPAGYNRLTNFFMDRGRYKQAEQVARKVLALDPQYYRAYMDLANIYYDNGDYLKAEKMNKAALEYVGSAICNREIIYFNLGLIYEAEKKPQPAWEYSRRAYNLHACASPSTYWQSEYLRHVARGDKKKYFEYIKGIFPKQIQQRRNSILRDIKSKRYSKAISECRRYFIDNPQSVYTDLFVALEILAKVGLGDYPKMESHIAKLEKSGLKESEIIWFKHSLADIFFKQKKYDQALNYLNEIRTNYPRYQYLFKVLVLTADAYEAKGKLLQALSVYQEIIDKFPRSWYIAQVYFERAAIYQRLGDYLSSYEEYLKSKSLVSTFVLNFIFTCLMAAFFMAIFFVLTKIFFRRKLRQLKASPLFKRFDLFVFIVLLLVVYPTMHLYLILPLNYNFWQFFQRLHLNPIMLSNILSDIVLVGVCWFYLKKKYKLDKLSLGFFSRGWKFNLLLPILVVAVTIGIAFLFSVIISLTGAEPPSSPLKELADNIIKEGSITQMSFLFICIVLIGPIAEEIIFRVFLLNSLKRYSNTVLAAILSSLVFALLHYGAIFLPYFFTIGIILSFLYAKTKTIIPSMVTHALYNGFIFVIWSISFL